MKQYNNLIKKIIQHGEWKYNRTGIQTKGIFGHSFKFDLREGFPLVTSKKTNFEAVVGELIWFLSGSTNINDLNSNIWNEWALPDGSIGAMYGEQFHKFNQIHNLLHTLRSNPHSRRHVLTMWDREVLPDEGSTPQENVRLGNMALAPCHGLTTQFYVDTTGRYLDMITYQRSMDVGLGCPFNLASYALLQELIALHTGFTARNMLYHVGDAHIYENHLEKLSEVSLQSINLLPTLVIDKQESIFDYKVTDISVDNYNPNKYVKLKVAI